MPSGLGEGETLWPRLGRNSLGAGRIEQTAQRLMSDRLTGIYHSGTLLASIVKLRELTLTTEQVDGLPLPDARIGAPLLLPGQAGSGLRSTVGKRSVPRIVLAGRLQRGLGHLLAPPCAQSLRERRNERGMLDVRG